MLHIAALGRSFQQEQAGAKQVDWAKFDLCKTPGHFFVAVREMYLHNLRSFLKMLRAFKDFHGPLFV